MGWLAQILNPCLQGTSVQVVLPQPPPAFIINTLLRIFYTPHGPWNLLGLCVKGQRPPHAIIDYQAVPVKLLGIVGQVPEILR